MKKSQSSPTSNRQTSSNIQYYDRSLSFFDLVCKKIGLNTQDRTVLKKRLKNTQSGQRRDKSSNEPYKFTYADLFKTLNSHIVAKGFCKNNLIKNWTGVVDMFSPKK